MKTVQMTLDEDLVLQVDKAVSKLKTTRSAFARDALRSALENLRVRELEARHRKGYREKPVKRGEFDRWQDEQAWPE